MNRPLDRVFHCVAIKGDPGIGKLVGYVELFSIYRCVIALSENYNGPEIAANYSIDPTTGEALELEFDLNFNEEEFRFAVDNMDETAVTARFQATPSGNRSRSQNGAGTSSSCQFADHA